MVYSYASEDRQSQLGARSLLLIDEIFLFLVRHKLGLFEQDLTYPFQIHMLSVCRKVTLTTYTTYNSSKEVSVSGHQRMKFGIICQRECVSLSNYKSDSRLYWNWINWNHPTWGSFIYFSVICRIHFRKEITRFSGILDLLDPGDSVMKDKGFNIDDLLREKRVGLNLLPFLQNQVQFSASNVLETKIIAKLRIHVERAIQRMKEFLYFYSDVPLSRLGSVNQLYTVACLLTNFQGPILLHNTARN